MVPTTKAWASPSERKRKHGAPAFLRQTRQVKEHRLGLVLSIFHEIPVVRNTLLRAGEPARSYGHNTEWWKGQPILKQEHLAAVARGEQLRAEEARPDFNEELHRLMAFLDNTERAYGTVDALAETEAVDPLGSWYADIEERFFEALKAESAANPAFDVSPLMTISKIHPVVPRPPGYDPNESSDDEEQESEAKFALLDVCLDQEQYAWVNSLYDALDHLFWQHALSPDRSFPEDASSAFLTEPGDVLTIRFGGSGLTKPCEIPGILYLDRWLESRRDLAVHFQTQIHTLKSHLQKLAEWEEQYVRCNNEQDCSSFSWLDNPHDTRDCCQKMISTAEYLMERQRKDAQWRYFQSRRQCGAPYSLNDIRQLHDWSGPFELTAEEQEKQHLYEHTIRVAREKIAEVEGQLARKHPSIDCTENLPTD